jgi:ribosome-binding factor A
VAKVYVSFFGACIRALMAALKHALTHPIMAWLSGDDGRTDVAFSGLQRLEGYLRSQVGKAMQLRFVPELRFIRDEGAERGGRVLSLLSGLSSVNAPGRAAAARTPSLASDVENEDEEDDESGSGSDVELISFSSDSDADVIMIHSDGEVST